MFPDACRARACKPGGARCSCALPAAICGPGGKRIARPRSAVSAILISSAPTARAAESFAPADELAAHVERLWGEGTEQRLVVITGGEPMLQLDAALVDALHGRDFRVAVETNGTLPAVAGLDWICVSPKAGTEVVQREGNELKLVWPQQGIDPAELERGASTISSSSRWTARRAMQALARRSSWRWIGRSGACRCRRTRWSACPDYWRWRSALTGSVRGAERLPRGVLRLRACSAYFCGLSAGCAAPFSSMLP